MPMKKTCAHCEYFKINESDYRAPAGVEGKPGMCLRFPPVPMIMQHSQIAIGDAGIGMVGANPPVTSIHTCGEWQRAHVTPTLS